MLSYGILIVGVMARSLRIKAKFEIGVNLEGDNLMFCVHAVPSLFNLLQNPAIADIYTEHAHQVFVAKYSPSGYYIASGGKCPE